MEIPSFRGDRFTGLNDVKSRCGIIHLRKALTVTMPNVENNPKAKKSEGMYCYLAGVLFPIIYLSSEPYKSNSFLRFHSFQSIMFTITFAAVTITNDHVRFQMKEINTLLSIVWLVLFITWIALMIKAYRGQRVKLPLFGRLAERWAG